jgi:hypothetical protein
MIFLKYHQPDSLPCGTITLSNTSTHTVTSAAQYLCPDLLRYEQIGAADNLRGRVVRLFFLCLRVWPPASGDPLLNGMNASSRVDTSACTLFRRLHKAASDVFSGFFRGKACRGRRC